MNIEQERAFEQILHSIQQAQIPGNDWRRELKLIESTCRAALQSQDREDAERYRAWRKAAATNNGNFFRLVINELPDWDEGPVDESRVDAAIDHARRVEGES